MAQNGSGKGRNGSAGGSNGRGAGKNGRVTKLRTVAAAPAISIGQDFAAVEDFSSFAGKSVLVTGGTGSFGRRFVEELMARAKPKRLIVFSRDEYKQYEMQSALDGRDARALRFFIGDVRDVERLELAMREVDFVIHAAALKHVPAAEYNPFECIKTNVEGAQNVVTAALRCGVERVVALSTDKAANPINLYGASKLASDKIFIAANNMSGSVGTRFSVVRYGNVMESRGGVVELFDRLLRQGATELPITDPRMSRFWITLRQGVDFVVSSLAMMQGGEIFVPKIPSMNVLDLANSLAPGLPHRVIGIRPGEKLHEVLVTEDDARQTIELQDRYVIEPLFRWWKRTPYVALGAKPVPEGFRYASDTNAHWLDAEGVHRLLAGPEAAVQAAASA
ncbi:UDP-N-acetylglucosamine 4,6-dehydratase (inverting) [Marinibaculum pumilum]|uniref:UDP-N-acetylglucosamine 4,6-dehydratase (Inverting) n=1 Tax=Marinibaculum pumilum TaxID=1766165 RepID=A0ABV7L472_9PROT